MAKNQAKSIEKKPANKKETVFVIMPFGGYFDKYYTDIYAPAIEEAGYEALKVSNLSRSSDILHDIVTNTKNAVVILADLTDSNPNVYYELGLAHALKKPVILINNNTDKIPFDLRNRRVLHYDVFKPTWGYELKNRIVIAIKETINEPMLSIPSSLITDDDLNTKLEVSSSVYFELRKDIERLDRELTDIRNSANYFYPRPVVGASGTLHMGYNEELVDVSQLYKNFPFVPGLHNPNENIDED